MKRRGVRILIGLLVVVFAALVVNDLLARRETAPARADMGRLLQVPGGVLQVREDGRRSAPAIVLIHGFDASMRWWDRVVPSLARTHRVIRVDLLGHGGSSKPSSGYSMENQARVVADALRQLRVRRPLVVGHSMGANVAIALAAAQPRRVRGLVIVDQGARAGEDRLGLTAELGFYPLVGPAIDRLSSDDMIYRAMSVGFAPGYRFPRSFVQDNRRMTYPAYNESASSSGDFVKAEPLDRRLTRLRLPTLVLFGALDQIERPRAAERYRDVPGVVIRRIPGAGHSPMWEKPLPTMRHILNFDRGLPGGGRAA